MIITAPLSNTPAISKRRTKKHFAGEFNNNNYQIYEYYAYILSLSDARCMSVINVCDCLGQANFMYQLKYQKPLVTNPRKFINLIPDDLPIKLSDDQFFMVMKRKPLDLTKEEKSFLQLGYCWVCGNSTTVN